METDLPGGDEPNTGFIGNDQAAQDAAEAFEPKASDLVPEDIDGDGTLDPEDQPVAFDVPDNLKDQDYRDALKSLIEKTREKITAKMVAKAAAKQSKAMGLFVLVMLGVAGAGLLLLLMPLFLKKKYPGREKLLWKGSLLAAGAWVSTMLVFTVALVAVRFAKDQTAMVANPSLAVAHSSFDAASEAVDTLDAWARGFIEAPIAKLGSGQEDDLLEAVVGNVAQFKDEFSFLMSVKAFFKSLNWLFGSLGTILIVLTVGLFMLSQKRLIGDILKVPLNAAAGDGSGFGAAYADMTKRTGREVAGLLSTIGFLVVLALFSGVVLYIAVGPSVHALFEYLFDSIRYLMQGGSASKLVVYVSLFGSALFLAMVILFILLGNIFFLGKAQKIFQQKFRHQLPLGTYRKFWIWGPIAALWIQIIPIIFIIVAAEVITAIDIQKGEIIGDAVLIVGPLILALGLPILTFALQGFRGLKFLRKFDHLVGRPEQKAPSTAAPAPSSPV